jgi:hypothetical protein
MLAAIASAWLCSLYTPPGETVLSGVEGTRQLIARAEAVVWVTGARTARPKDIEKAPVEWQPAGAGPPNVVAFDVHGVLKGESVPRVIIVEGTVSDADDFNEYSVPYPGVRSEGRKGSCFADVYKRGGQFLLLLVRAGANRYTPYWAPLLPVNEQIRGTSDPWLAWVRNEIASQRGA